MKQVSIYIPTDQELSCMTIAAVSRAFCAWFGGATTHAADGHWTNASQVIVSEPVCVVTAIGTAAAYAQYASRVRELAVQVKKDLWQDCVLLTVQDITGELV